VAKGFLSPTLGDWIGNPDLTFFIPTGVMIPLLGQTIPSGDPGLTFDLIYWTGTAVIAVFVLGACNASNLIDGLDGLLSGTTAICTAALLVVALSLAVTDDGPRDAQRIILCMALLGASLGFLPHNFSPATIFLGDCGSLLMGFATIVIVLTLGDTGRTHLVLAGLVIYAIPIMDTCLAIVRRKLAGKRLSDPDADHLHHMLKRSLGVKGAVLTLYAIGALFGAMGIAMSLWRARVTYAIAGIFIAYIAVISIKIARRKQIEEATAERAVGAVGPASRTIPPHDEGKAHSA
jgi:UDP-GlcNAc:undecaprenyl-phosphate/decaprenyl-phosphate GlcNAc-1-phosphate transferase